MYYPHSGIMAGNELRLRISVIWERWGKMTEKNYRNCFKKFFDWFEYNYAVLSNIAAKK